MAHHFIHGRIFRLLLGGLGVWLAAGAGETAPPAGLSFSSQVVRILPGQGETGGIMYFSPAGIRSEANREGKPLWMILNFQQRKAWLVFPEKRQYAVLPEMPAGIPPAPGDPGSPCQTDPAIGCRVVGSEAVQGRPATKWEIAPKSPDKPGEKVEGIFFWVDNQLGIPIREAYPGGAVLEFRNLKVGTLPADLFQLPAGFQEVVQPAPSQPGSPPATR